MGSAIPRLSGSGVTTEVPKMRSISGEMLGVVARFTLALNDASGGARARPISRRKGPMGKRTLEWNVFGPQAAEASQTGEGFEPEIPRKKVGR